ncbi:FKBP-type peptidylprolyl isomerase [Pseudomonas sp. M47T1]|uniref:FKBP-type peptidyl-prolyl cis-trans isomerase n=1 Tax=unclassified Pseudomonas TaxID=196821 RepID=UPI000260721E|nr:FKBP-type peptidyl-prolyl cis-trans isomerase [Pseudomonas sp. M47T1]EIK97271.1 FKBP-type peptidylprolyl isomerase [Pseudomonas sp. M47T1]
MPRHLLLSLWLLLPLAHAAEPASPTSPHDLAYSLGASLGERLREEAPGVDIQALVQGLQQSYENKPLALPPERIEQILREHDAQASEAPAPSPTEKALMAEQRFMAGERTKAGVHELADGILMSELTAGDGPHPTADGRVQVTYVGMLPDGTVFDQNQQAQWFRLDSVISGWRVTLQQMPKGAKWRVVIPSDQAYGADGAGDLIPPYTPLVFEISLLDVGA